ncbi:subclass B3 metallo-beta-lactamase [Frateuria soli]|uniref:subclass B3 metallo-beta-lactamase n=1 Tax=Frateuria soli TaxID=1542730 RepID=UPI001E5B72FA|nr:subclass B3 metallo-beta-lactamase [Frateuria soli]UGB38906.1 subclass B3 metallo-beta-lactamase [Frateuria soli]
MRLAQRLTLPLCLLLTTGAGAADSHSPGAALRATWRQPQAPERIYGNTWYVGSHGLSAILITSPRGHVLIDGTLPENAAMVEANIRALGFRVRDIKMILASHAHADHAGAIATLARDSGAGVAARASQARALRAGDKDVDDPQHGDAPLFPDVRQVRTIADDAVVRVGTLAIQAHATPGHTPGSTSWTWTSCEGTHCLSMVYADSLSLLAAGDYRYTDPAHPERLGDFRRALAMISALPCDILMTPHPEASGLLQRLAARDAGKADALRDARACGAYADLGERSLRERIHQESAPPR